MDKTLRCGMYIVDTEEYEQALYEFTPEDVPTCATLFDLYTADIPFD